FDQQVDQVRADSGCACGRIDPVEKEALRRYDLGPTHCSRTKAGACRMIDFLAARRDAREQILKKLRSLPPERKSREMTATQEFLERMAKDHTRARQEDPCL